MGLIHQSLECDPRTLFLIAALSVLVYLILFPYIRRLPPGPRPLPLIGNLHQTPRELPWVKFQEWHQQYGPIVSLQVGQRVIVLLGTHQAARELLEIRKENYSSRPRMVVADESVAKGLNPGLLPYNDKFKAHHRLQSTLLSPKLVKSYRIAQEVECNQLLIELLEGPVPDFFRHLQRYTTSYMFTLAYGKRFSTMDHPEIQELLEFTDGVSDQMGFSTFLVEAFPILNHLPRALAPWKAMGDHLHEGTLRLFTKHLKDGAASPSWNWSRYAPTILPDELDETDLAFALGVLLEAAIDTTLGSLKVFVLASVLHPDATREVQAELDRVVGSDRLPTFDDLPQLPCLGAFIKEVLRWRPILPAGVPHAPLHDDIYQGYRIPAGTAVIPVHWSLDMDDRIHNDPASFDPKRWIEKPNAPLAAFGFGRRTCLGRSSALNAMGIAIARCLWAFDIGPAVDENGVQIPVDPWKLDAKATAAPAPFPASFTVRSAQHRTLVEETWQGTERDVDAILRQVESLQQSLA